MRVIVTGATGLLGRAVMKVFSDAEVLVGISKTRTGPNIRNIDLTQREEVEKLIDEIQPNFIIHCAAERHPEACESNPDVVSKLNVDVTGDFKFPHS
jgi:S-adenosylmethionine synthetase